MRVGGNADNHEFNRLSIDKQSPLMADLQLAAAGNQSACNRNILDANSRKYVSIRARFKSTPFIGNTLEVRGLFDLKTSCMATEAFSTAGSVCAALSTISPVAGLCSDIAEPTSLADVSTF